MLGTLRAYLQPRRHSALLIAIITAFAVRPLIGDGGSGPAVFSIAMVILMVFALYAIQIDELVGERDVLLAQRKRRSLVGWTLASLAIAERVATLTAPNPHLLRIGAISWFLFFAFVTWTELRSVLKQKAVTSETISMSISVYLLLGFTWGLLYAVIFEFHPDAFNFPGGVGTADGQPPLAVLAYFSLTTLSTIGYGDITPLTLQSRYAAVAEGITGQFYLAILVARLVGMQMNPAPEKPVEPE